jgi:uncharacterized membrane protein
VLALAWTFGVCLFVTLAAAAGEHVATGEPGLAPPTLSVRPDRPASELPFWRTRPALQKKIREERAIVVSVKREETDGIDKRIRFTMNGAGLVAKPKDFSFEVSQRYEKLKEISHHFRTVEFDEKSRQLLLVTEALGYQARMVLKLTPVSEDWRSELQWEVIWGHFKGMKGIIGYERIDERRTEVSLHANYEAAELPLPKILMGFALEVITQKVAEKMRSYIEAQVSSRPLVPLSPLLLQPEEEEMVRSQAPLYKLSPD